MIFENALRKKYRDFFFFRALEKQLVDCESVLDVGCGGNSPLGYLRKTFYSEGMDLYGPNITRSKKNKFHDKYTAEDIRRLDKVYRKKTFDAVVALDVIEHLGKKDGPSLLDKMERIAKKKVVLLTPNGFVHQGHHEGNPYEEHKSGWTTSELRQLGYTVYGLRGLRYLRGEYTSIKYKPWFFWAIVAFISEPILYFFPSFSYHLFAIKELHDE